MSQSEVNVAIPIGVYVAGRIIERGLTWLWYRVRGNFQFIESLEGEMARLIIRSRSTIFLDEFTIHLDDRQIDVLGLIRTSLKMTDSARIQLDATDKIVLEFIIQQHGDRKMFVNSYLGSTQAVSETDLVTRKNTVNQFVYETRIVVETSERHYDRNIFKGLP
jgi:hypothetical protein